MSVTPIITRSTVTPILGARPHVDPVMQVRDLVAGPLDNPSDVDSIPDLTLIFENRLV